MKLPADWRSLRELDRQAGTPKGSAFRVFKRLAPGLTEQRDFWVLHAARDAAQIAALRDADRIYTGSVNVVLLAPAAQARVLDAIRGK